MGDSDLTENIFSVVELIFFRLGKQNLYIKVEEGAEGQGVICLIQHISS